MYISKAEDKYVFTQLVNCTCNEHLYYDTQAERQTL